MTDQGRFAAHADIEPLIVNAWRLRHDDTRQARGMALQALAVAQTRADDRGKAWAALRLTVCNQVMAVEPEAELPRLHECVTAMRALGGGACLRRGCAVPGSIGRQRAGHRLRSRRTGLTELLAGDVPTAVRHLELCFAAAVRTEDRALECTALTRLAQARLLLGEVDQARELLGHAQAMARRTGNVRDAGRVCLVWGLLERACGRADRAEVHFEAAMHEARRSHDLSLVSEVESARAALAC
ncbi:hypothetical protein [Rubrivivax albus]|uniref:Tetratricopeptide repeat protein n=1 Tax=Rubrivivax albus TaxID=2499835 RepID=A0A3S2TRX1_9BURK|nr:hypothetical protein [Rubrivivax albus]RVT52529.1 hypothetical protein ENE75_08850 [Rubrivivax albus]